MLAIPLAGYSVMEVCTRSDPNVFGQPQLALRIGHCAVRTPRNRSAKTEVETQVSDPVGK